MVLGLGTSGSILVVGLVAGWGRSRYPVFGAIPEPAQRLLMDIGLIVFIAVIGLQAGPHAVEAYRDQRRRLVLQHLRRRRHRHASCRSPSARSSRDYVLKMSPLMILGGLAGAQTCTPGLNALREASGSNVGSLAYTVPYAIGNILLTVWGPVVVAIVHAMRYRGAVIHETRTGRPSGQVAQPLDRLRSARSEPPRPARPAAVSRRDRRSRWSTG